MDLSSQPINGPKPTHPGYGQRSRWSPWLWLFTISLTFAFGYIFIGFKVGLICSLAMWISALLQRMVGSPFRAHRVTIGSFWFIGYLVMVFFPAFFVYDEERDPFRGPFLFAVTTVLITVPLGFILASKLSNFRESETESFFRRPLQVPAGSARVPLKFLALLGVGLVLIVLYMRQVETVPFFYLLRHPGEYWILGLLREDAFKLLASSLKYLFYLARGLLFPFLILTAFGYFITTRRKQWLAAFLLAILSGLFFAALSIAKSPVAAIFLVLVLFVYYYRHGGFNYKYVGLALIVVLSFPLFIALAVGGQEVSFASSLQGLGFRLTYGPSEVVYYHFEVFPSHLPYLHGRSIGMVSKLFGLNYVDVPNFVGLYSNPNNIESISFNGAFISDMHANFGLPGVLLGGVLTGAIMQAFHIFLVRRRKTVCSIATYCFLVFTFWFLNSTSLPVVLASDGAVAVLALLWWFDGKPWPKWFARDVQRSLVPS